MSSIPQLTSNLPPRLTQWLEGASVGSGFSAIDLREMSKHGETTNILGCTMHALRLPPDPSGLLETPAGLEDLEPATANALAEALRAEPLVLLHRELAGATSRARTLAFICPQRWAQLGLAIERLTWAASAIPEQPEQMPDLTIIQLPEFPDSVMLNLPKSQTALILGTDDPRPGLVVALEQANRVWSAEFEASRKKSPPPEAPPLMSIAPGGTFLFQENNTDESYALAFPGESVPLSWEEDLIAACPTLSGLSADDVRLAGAEPWVVESGGHLSPFWRNPLLPCPLLKAGSRWTDAVLDPDSVMLGVPTNTEGQADFSGSSAAEGIVICPRARIPHPFASGSKPIESIKPSRFFTHKNAKPDALDYWALGLPSPEIPD